MAKNSITDYDNIAANNTDIQSVDIDEGCAPSGINNAIREIMADLADVNDGTVPLASPDINGGTIDGVTIGGTTAGAGTFTTGTFTSGASSAAVHSYTQLEIESASHSALQFSGSTGAEQWIWFADDSSNPPVGGITYYHGGPYMGFRVEGSERLRIDNSGNVGIGTSSPSYAIDTLSSGAIVAQFKRDASGGGSGGIRFGNNDKQFTLYGDNSNGLTIYDGSTERMRIDGSGNVGIGTSSPDAKMNIEQSGAGNFDSIILSRTTGNVGDVQSIVWQQNDLSNLKAASISGEVTGASAGALVFNTATGGTLTERALLDSSGNLHVDGNVIAYSTTISDKRLKKDIQPIENALWKVNQINGCTFTYLKDDRKSAGLIAQDLEKVLPSAVIEDQAVFHGEEGETYKTVQYDQVIGLLVEAIKELNAKVEGLENGITS